MKAKCEVRSAKCKLDGACSLSMFVLLPCSFILAGCTPYAQVQIDLLEQSRKGIAHAKAAQSAYASVSEQLHELELKRLNDAFDADVRETPDIDADWIIEHRRAYAAALEAMARLEAADHAGVDTAQRNLDAIDQAMQRLEWLQSVPLKWFGETMPVKTP